MVVLYLFLFLFFPSSLHKGFFALYSHLGGILALHLEGQGSFPLILVSSGLY